MRGEAHISCLGNGRRKLREARTDKRGLPKQLIRKGSFYQRTSGKKRR